MAVPLVCQKVFESVVEVVIGLFEVVYIEAVQQAAEQLYHNLNEQAIPLWLVLINKVRYDAHQYRFDNLKNYERSVYASKNDHVLLVLKPDLSPHKQS